MKKHNKIAAALLTTMIAASLGSGTAMAAEVQNTTDTYPESVVGIEDEMARLKRLNPHLTEEQWETVEKYQDPEANGLILVSEEQRVEDGQLIVDSYYTDAVSPLVSGRKTYSAFTRIFSDGTTDGELLLSIYMNATFNYNSEDNYIEYERYSVDGFYLKQVDTEYPIVLGDNKTLDPVYDEDMGIRRGTALYVVTVRWWDIVRNYTTVITVDSSGRQIGSGLTDRGM